MMQASFSYDGSSQQTLSAYKFTGKERDSESALDNVGARYNASSLGRFITPDLPLVGQDRRNPQSWNLYAYVQNRPSVLVDPDGRSTHTAANGMVLAVYDDGDNGVYKHDDIDNLQDWDGSKLDSDDEGSDYMGETHFWDEFREHDNKTGAVKDNVAKGAQILFGFTFDDTVNLFNMIANQQDLATTASQSTLHGFFDIKNSGVAPFGPNTGALLNGEYATARSAGNYLAGLNAATGTEFGFHISFETFLKLAGAVQTGDYSKANALRIITTGKAFGPPPWYGEIEYTGRMTKLGFQSARPQ